MKRLYAVLFIGLGIGIGIAGSLFYLAQPRIAVASTNDRYGDYIMATGAVALNPKVPTDGVWLLDYRTGRLLGTVVDRNSGRIVGFAEVDLTTEFGLAVKQDVHFMMVCGNIAQGQSALYVTEVTTGKFGVYTMGTAPNGTGIAIRRHDLVNFRNPMADQGVPAVPQQPPVAQPPRIDKK